MSLEGIGIYYVPVIFIITYSKVKMPILDSSVIKYDSENLVKVSPRSTLWT